MYHELFGPRGAEDERGDFWTSIPEGGDMLPGMLPGEDHTEAPGAARSHRHAHQAGDVTPQEIDELRQALMDRPELVDRLYQMAGDDVAQGFSSNTLAAAELRCGAQGAMLLLNSVQRTE